MDPAPGIQRVEVALTQETVSVKASPTYCDGVGSSRLKFSPLIVTDQVAPEMATLALVKG
jgi:hypothetical protein